MNGELTKKRGNKLWAMSFILLANITFRTTFFVSDFQVIEQEAWYRQRAIK